MEKKPAGNPPVRMTPLRLKSLLEEHRISQGSMAKLLGISLRKFARCCNGEIAIPPYVVLGVRCVIEYYGISDVQGKQVQPIIEALKL